MAIEKISIRKFRGFQNVGFELGSHLTVIAGQNGTQKTTLLGMLTQPFAITDSENPLSKEKPLCGGNYKSAFSEKFKLSSAFDIPKEHEWTLTYDGGKLFTIESIKPNDDRKNPVRFWQKGTRSRGSGYIPKPVIYLSLSRLLPIGEDNDVMDRGISLSEEEQNLYKELHDDILCIRDIRLTKVSHLEGGNKNTLGANTDIYDWKMNSAGQDDLGKIILAMLSFKRLKENHKDFYDGGILAIDELDATLYPASQEKLIDKLRRYASKYDIQIIFTTHSLSMLEHIYALQKAQKKADDIRIVYLEKEDSFIKVLPDPSFEDITCKLKILAGKESQEKVLVFSEDDETRCWIKTLLGSRKKYLKFVNCKIGCDSLIQLTKQKIPPFCFPNSMIILDGDATKKVVRLKNYMVLPGGVPPERVLAEFLNGLRDVDDFWTNCRRNYTKQVAFRDINLSEIQRNRESAKKWFKSQLPYWGRNASKAINAWVSVNPEEKKSFIARFDSLLNSLGKA
ncbi:MAG: AAA family ATPase [Fibrobacteraceae bacterium]|nr:AAA family ATPase [Fibrobacteraceae bacterium]